VFTRQLFPRCSDIEKLVYSAGILSASTAGSQQVAAVVNDITKRWNNVVAKASKREVRALKKYTFLFTINGSRYTWKKRETDRRET